MKIQRPFAFHSPLKRVSGAAARKRPSNTLDMQNLLHFSKELYAHALTLQEVIRNGGEYRTRALSCDRQAAQQFEIFYHAFRRFSLAQTWCGVS